MVAMVGSHNNHSIAGGFVTSQRACFSSDGKWLLLCNGSRVQTFSASSGVPHITLSAHTLPVTCVLNHPKSSRQVYTSSLDATLRLWDLRDGSLVRTLQAPAPVDSFVILPGGGGIHAVLCCHHENRSARLYVYNLASGRLVGKLGKLSSTSRLAMSKDGGYVAAFDRQSLFVWQTSNLFNKGTFPLYVCHDNICTTGVG
jgi:WD40 repeat protein